MLLVLALFSYSMVVDVALFCYGTSCCVALIVVLFSVDDDVVRSSRGNGFGCGFSGVAMVMSKDAGNERRRQQ